MLKSSQQVKVWNSYLLLIMVKNHDIWSKFLLSRTAHFVLCGGRHQWVVLSALAGDPTQSLHCAAEQSPQTGGELRTHRKGLKTELAFLLACLVCIGLATCCLNLVQNMYFKDFCASAAALDLTELMAFWEITVGAAITPVNLKSSCVWERDRVSWGFTSR